MNSDFARAMGRATASVRKQDLAGATAIIRAAIAGSRSEEPSDPPTTPAFRVVPDVEDVELVHGADPTGAIRERPAARRRRLRDVIDLLRSGRRAFDRLDLRPGSVGRPPAPASPNGASFVWRSHANAASARRYRLFVPSCATTELQGMVVMLHGCKQDPDDFAAGTGINALAEAHRLLVAYPEQPGTANVSRCWNWFDPAHQRRGSGEPAEVAALTRALITEFGLPADRTFVAGLSAGGAMAAVLAETYPDLFAAVGIHSGLAYGSASDVVSAFAAMRGQPTSSPRPRSRPGLPPRVIVFHGAADRTVHPGNAEAIVIAAQAERPGAVITVRGGDGARTWHCSRVADARGVPHIELWLVEGAGHAWSGGHVSGSFTDTGGPSASAEMLRFFLSEPAESVS
jgi:poly(hydroxyalkanoate) depolymerase family esterase